MQRSEIIRRQFSESYQSNFSRKHACWANNHRGWQKMKKKNTRAFKKKFRRELDRKVETFIITIYGKEGNYSIYPDSEKVMITDEQAAEIREYLKQKEKYKKKVEEIKNA